MLFRIVGDAGMMDAVVEAQPVASASANPSLALRRTVFVALLLWGVGAIWLEGLASVGLGIVVLAALVTQGRELPQRAISLGRKWHLLIIFVAWALLAPFLAGHRPTGTGVGRLFDWLALPAVVWAWGFLSRAQARRLLIIWSAFLAVSCLLAVCQYFGVWPAQEKIEGLRRLTHLHFEHAYEEPRGIPGRFYGVGLVFHRLKFAHVGALLTVFVAYGAFRAKGVWRWLGFALVVLSIVTITQFALVRSASASLVVVLALVWAMLQQRPGRAFLLGSLGAVMVMGLLALQPQVRMRFAASIDPKSHGDRPELWAAGWRAWKTSPVVGIGYDQFHPGKFPSDEMPDHIQKHGGKAHNQFLTIAAETGVPGALLFIAMLLWFARRLLRNRVVGAAGLGALAFFVLLSALHDPLFHAQFSMGFVLALGVSLAMVERGDEPTEGTAS